jgi:sugar fermentation stimulation protein A
MSQPHLIQGELIRRYKRFLVDITLKSALPNNDQAEETTTAHCANPGSMRGLIEKGARVWLSDSYDPNDPKTHKRKLRYSLEHIELSETPTRPSATLCANTLRANAVAHAGIKAGRVSALTGLTLRAEVPWDQGTEKARLDFALYPLTPQAHPHPTGYLEVKSATLSLTPHEAAFPDSVTERGQKHLKALIEIKRAGLRAVLLFVIMRDDARSFRAAHEIDPRYAALLQEARDAGVEIYAHTCHIDPTAPLSPTAGVTLGAEVPIVWRTPTP